MSALITPEFNTDEILAALHANGASWIKQVEHFKELNSSNTHLMREHSSVHGHLCIVDFQSSGRGRRGKLWQSDAGSSLMFSLGYVPNTAAHSETSLIVGVAIADVLRKRGLTNVNLKWPNDVLVEDRKLAGILLESRHLGSNNETVIGVGLNVEFTQAQLDDIPTPCVSLAQLGINNINKQVLLIELMSSIIRRLGQFEADCFAPIRTDWLSYQSRVNDEVSFEYDGLLRTGHINGLGANGELLIESNQEVLKVTSGEISTIRGNK